MKIGILGGTAFFTSKVLTEGEERKIFTSYGSCNIIQNGNIYFIPRHGRDGKTLPHAVNHQLHIAALKKAGVEGIVSFGSVGSLNKIHGPGTVLLIDSYFSPFKLTTFRNREFKYIVPDMRHGWRDRVKSILVNNEIPFIDGGIYAETIGPRFETPSEIKYLQEYADVVGMTCASEIILSQEIGLPQATIAMVDNFANGVAENPLTRDAFEKGVAENKRRVEDIFHLIVKSA